MITALIAYSRSAQRSSPDSKPEPRLSALGGTYPRLDGKEDHHAHPSIKAPRHVHSNLGDGCYVCVPRRRRKHTPDGEAELCTPPICTRVESVVSAPDPRHLRSPLDEIGWAGDREGAARSSADEGLRACPWSRLRFGWMSITQSRSIGGSTHTPVDVGQPQSRSCKVSVLLPCHNNRETPQVEIKGIEDGGMAQGRATRDTDQCGELLFGHPTIILVARQSRKPHQCLNEDAIGVGHSLIVSGLRSHNKTFTLLRRHGENAGMLYTVLIDQDIPPPPRVPEVLSPSCRLVES